MINVLSFSIGDPVHTTMFDNKIIVRVLRFLSQKFLTLKGWEIPRELPVNLNKCVVVAAPHTTNWDLPYMLMFALLLHLRVYWLGKDSMFTSPFGFVLRWLGGVPVNRKKPAGLVDMCSTMITTSSKKIHLVIAPSGTRKNTPVKEWKNGFYRIAHQARVPLLLAALDYEKKKMMLSNPLVMTGKVEYDMKILESFYKPFIQQ